MQIPDMREYVRKLVDQTLSTVAKGRPNTIIELTSVPRIRRAHYVAEMPRLRSDVT